MGGSCEFYRLPRESTLYCRVGLVVFGPECQGIKYMPPEWTVGKSLKMFLLRKHNHYSVLRLQRGGTDVDLCASYRDTKEFVTADPTQASRARLQAAGATSIITKPVAKGIIVQTCICQLNNLVCAC